MRSVIGTIGLVGVIGFLMSGCTMVPAYNVYSKRMEGQAALAEAQSSRQVATLEAKQKMESADYLAKAEVTRAQGAAKANAILQNSLGGPEGYLRYLQIQAYETTNAKLIYVPTQGGLPVLEASRLNQ